MNYELELKAGNCLVKRIFPNTNGKNKMTVQFQQFKNNRPVSESSSTGMLAALANGLDPIEEGNHPTALMSFAPEILESLGIPEGQYDNGSKVLHASALWPSLEGTSFNIQVVENTTPEYKGQSPKRMGGTTDGDVLMYNGKPIYSHNNIVTGEPKDVYLAHTSTVSYSDYIAEQSLVEEGEELVVKG